MFLVAVRTGSYSAAAPVLGVNRTTVGRRIDALEAALGVSLFRDTPAGPEPTPEGKLLLDAATRMEAEVASLAAQLAPEALGGATIRIASSAGIAAEFLAEIAKAPAGV